MNRPLKSDSKSIASNDIHDWSPVEQYFLLRIDESDRILAQAMNSLSTEEREKVMEEVHGISKPIEEKTDFIFEKLAELDCEVSIRKNEAYEIGSKQKRGFVEDLSFRCMFLRCNSFDASAASKRMMHHLKLKETYFGEEKITKDIGFLDLSEEDIRSLESGVIQVLSEKDRSGRAVIAVFPFMWNGDNPQSMVSIARSLLLNQYLLSLASQYPLMLVASCKLLPRDVSCSRSRCTTKGCRVHLLRHPRPYWSEQL